MIMRKRIVVLLTALMFTLGGIAQTSIHKEQSLNYAAYGELTQEEYDELNGFVKLSGQPEIRGELHRTVFGYHPYWGGSNYLNYHWDLLSDLCYFSYEVDPESGNAVTFHDWLTSPAIDSALANGTRVHLCVTLFSGQSIFFNNPLARQTLTNNLISLVKQRSAHGVSFDFEAVPASQGENMVAYVGEFAGAFRDSIPNGILSIAMPAVDWSGIFDVQELNKDVDLYMIMGYDYYWNGSTTAGPVDPHYSMTSGYNYSISRTVSYYQSEGMPMNKMLLGVPYYAREWPTASQYAPSATTGNGAAYTWANIMNNTSGNYSAANKHIEPNSFSPYYSYYGSGWNQCFVNDVESLTRRYKMVNRRGMAGIGIWALGYDNGYTELWELIQQNFTQEDQITWWDEIYDSGGPAWDYYNGEEYVLTYHGEVFESMRLGFLEFDLEPGYDSLWIYNGYFPEGELYGGFTGSTLPPVFYAMNEYNTLSIRFKSDQNTSRAGWKAVIENYPAGIREQAENDGFTVYPNPVRSVLNIESPVSGVITIHDLAGNIVARVFKGEAILQIDLSEIPPGVYMLLLIDKDQKIQQKIIKL
jgi:hypothetical protein